MKMVLFFILIGMIGLTFSGCFQNGNKMLFADEATQLNGERGNIVKMSEFDFVSCGPMFNCVITTENGNENLNQIPPFVHMPVFA